MKCISLLSIFLSMSALASVPKGLRVGLIVPETRQDHVTTNPWGVHQRRGFEMALDDAKNLSWTIKDNSESAIIARDRAIEFLKTEVDLIAGLTFSDQAMAVKQQTDPAGVPFLTVFGTSENLFTRNESVFTMAPSNEAQVAALVRYLLRFPETRKSGIGLIIARNCEYCVDMEKIFKVALSKAGVRATQFTDILKNRPVPHDYFAKIEPPKLLVILSYEVEGLSIINALAKRGYKGILLGGDTWSMRTMQIANNLGALSSICLVNPDPYDVRSSSKQNQDFVRRYRNKYHEDPTGVAALAYDAGTVIKLAAERCIASTERRRCMATAIAHLRIEGASGPIQFSSLGRRIGAGTLTKSNLCSQLERDYGFIQ